VPTGDPSYPKQRLPWLVAGLAILFAVLVLVRGEITQTSTPPVPQAPGPTVVPDVARTPLPTPTPTPAVLHTPTMVDLPPPQALPINTPVPLPTETPAPPPPTPTPSPTPPAVNALDGILTDPQGKPVSGARIRAGVTEGVAQRTLNLQSGSDGTFRLPDLKAAAVDTLVVEAIGYGRSVIEKIPLPLPDRLEISLTALAGLQVGVEVAGPDNNEVRKPFGGEAEFVLLRRKDSSEATTRTVGIREATLRDGSYVPVAEQRVTIVGGEFRLEELEPGEYKAALRAQDMYAESVPVQVTESGRAATTITLGLKWRVGGFVISEAEKQPVPAARVQFRRRSSPVLYTDALPLSTVAGDDGGFSLAAISPGQYLLTLGATGFTTNTATIEVPVAGPPAETTYTLGRKSPSIRITLRRADGSPIADAPVALLLTEPTTKTIFARTDDAGTYFFDRLSLGKYTISATAPESRSRQKSLTVDLHDGEAHDLEITFPKTVRVLGIARRSGKSYTGLLAFNLRGSVGMETMVKTDETGGYAADLEPGEYMVGTPEKPNTQVVVVRPDQQPRTDIEVE